MVAFLMAKRTLSDGLKVNASFFSEALPILASDRHTKKTATGDQRSPLREWDTIVFRQEKEGVLGAPFEGFPE